MLDRVSWSVPTSDPLLPTGLRVDHLTPVETEQSIRGSNWMPHAHSDLYEIGIYFVFPPILFRHIRTDTLFKRNAPPSPTRPTRVQI